MVSESEGEEEDADDIVFANEHSRAMLEFQSRLLFVPNQLVAGVEAMVMQCIHEMMATESTGNEIENLLDGYCKMANHLDHKMGDDRLRTLPPKASEFMPQAQEHITGTHEM